MGYRINSTRFMANVGIPRLGTRYLLRSDEFRMKDQGKDLPKSPLCWLAASCLSFALLPGCGDAPPRPTDEEVAGVNEDASRLFDPATAGTLRGRVTWTGAVPEVRPFMAPIGSGSEAVSTGAKLWDNPNKPSRRSAHARRGQRRGLPPRRRSAAGPPWDHPPVRVEQADYRIEVRQGQAHSAVRLCAPGERVEMVSTQEAFHSLHAGGAAFFTLAFPDPNEPCSRRLEREGRGGIDQRGRLLLDARLPVRGRPSLLHAHRRRRPVHPRPGAARQVRGGLLGAELGAGPASSATRKPP